MMWGRGETSLQGVANLMTADWLCIEHADGWARLFAHSDLPVCILHVYMRERARTCIDNVRIPSLQLARGRTMRNLTNNPYVLVEVICKRFCL